MLPKIRRCIAYLLKCVFSSKSVSRGAGTGGVTGANVPFAFLLRVQGSAGCKMRLQTIAHLREKNALFEALHLPLSFRSGAHIP